MATSENTGSIVIAAVTRKGSDLARRLHGLLAGSDLI